MMELTRSKQELLIVGNNHYSKQSLIIVSALSVLTVSSGAILASSMAVAEGDTAIDTVSIDVPTACTLGGTVGTAHTASVNMATVTNDIGTTTLQALCNDASGLAIYAIGFTGDTDGDNTMTDGTHTIATGTNTTGDSSWAMKLSTDSEATYPLTIQNSYDDYHAVPNDYQLVAKRTASTDTGENATGANLTTTYRVYIANLQPAGSYTGQVKYVLVHPNNAAAPVKPVSMSSCEDAAAISTVATGITYMQDITTSNKSTVLSNLTTDTAYTIKDNRDNTTYCVSKLADGNLWMLDNLALDIVANKSNIDATNTDINGADATESTAILTSLKDGNRTAGDNYATAGVSTDWNSSYSYSVPLYNLTSRDNIPSDNTSQTGKYKIGGYYNFCAASAGSYCYGNGTSEGTSSDDATSSICPKGWRLPTGGSSGEYNTLYTNSSYNTYANYRSALHLPLSGHYLSGSASSRGSVGLWWPSTRYNNYSMYTMGAGTSSIYPDLSYNRYDGLAIRCLVSS